MDQALLAVSPCSVGPNVERRLGLDQVESIWMAIWGKKFGFLLAFVGAKWSLHNLPTLMILR
jgi:hypothetical protein